MFIIKRGSPGLVITKIIQKEDILMLYLSVFKHPTLVRENIIALDLAHEGLKRPIFNCILQANLHIDSAARSNHTNRLHTDLSEIQFTPDNSTTLAKSNLVLTRTKIDFPCFFYTFTVILPAVTRTLDNFHLTFLQLRGCLHGGGGPQIGEVTRRGSPHFSCKRDQIFEMRDYMDRRVTSPTWGPSPPFK